MAHRCSYVLPVILGIVFIIIGFILTMVGNFRTPFFSQSSSSWCDFCQRDTDSTLRNNRNMKVVGPIMIAIGVIICVVSFVRCKSYQSDMARQQAAKFAQTSSTTATASTQQAHLAMYNTTGPSQPGAAFFPPGYNSIGGQQQQPYPHQPYPAAPYQATATYPQQPSPYPQQPAPYPQPLAVAGQQQQQQTPYPPMAAAPYPYPAAQSGFPDKAAEGAAPPAYADAVQATPSAPPS